jgi:hypothetical protein
MIRSIAVIALALAGCGSKPAPTTTSPKPTTADDQVAVCVASMTKSRECTDDFIPALVDARAQADAPAGVADAVKNDRDGVIKQAMEEWKTDSQDANIRSRCEAMAADVHVASEDLAATTDCNSKSDCKQFTSCTVPVVAKYFHK